MSVPVSRKKSKSEATSTDQVKLIFSEEYTFQVPKSQILSDSREKLKKFIEDTLCYMNVFQYPYEMFYYESNKEICHSIRSDETNKQIGDLLKELIISEKGEELEEIYFLADKKRGIKTFIYYNLDFITFLLFLFFSVWYFTTLGNIPKYALYSVGVILIGRLIKYVR